jgi:hypothetical protein
MVIMTRDFEDDVTEQLRNRSEQETWEDLILERDKQQKTENRTAGYLPTPKMIRRRLKFMKWMVRNHFSDRMIELIMIYDAFTIKEVKRLVREMGLKRARKFIKSKLNGS